MYLVKKANIAMIDRIMDIYSKAQDFMISTNNPNQWEKKWPSKGAIMDDIINSKLYLVCYKSEIVGVFSFTIGVDNTYIDIRNGKWLSNKTYGTIHSLASSFKYKGLFSFIQSYLEDKYDVNFRIDTHKDNKIMQHLVTKLGYKYCGIITPIHGGERLAYEKVINK